METPTETRSKHVPRCNAPSWSAPEVVESTGITYRQLDYWQRAGYIDFARAASGSGSRRALSVADVRVLIATGDISNLVRGASVKGAAELAADYRYCCDGALALFEIPGTDDRVTATVEILSDEQVVELMAARVPR